MSSKNQTSIHTIDEKHTEFLNEFNRKETELLPQLEQEKEDLKKYIQDFLKTL